MLEKLENVVDIYLGLTHTPEYREEGIPFLSVKDISNGNIDFSDCKYVSKEEFDSFPNGAKPKVGDLLFCRVGTIGKPIIIDESIPEFGTFVSLGFLRKKTNEIDLKYLKYWMESNSFNNQVLENINGVSQKNLNTGWLKKFIFINNSLLIQKRIIQILDIINEIIFKKRQQLSYYDELIKSRFIEQFGKYDKVELHTISKITMGQSPDSSSYNDEGNGVPFFQGKGDYGEKYTVVRHYTTSPKKIAKKDSVLMSVRAPVGPVNIANTECCIGRGLCSIDAIEGLTNNEFIYNALNAMQDEISGKGNGSTFSAINKDDVYKLFIPNAPINEQNDFSDFVKLIDKSKFIIQKQIKLLEELLEKKMNEYFGEYNHSEIKGEK